MTDTILKGEPEAMRDVWAGVIERAEQQDHRIDAFYRDHPEGSA